MGKALYRTYRSRGFEEVVGQKHITDTLQNAINSGKLSHAYLFTGPKGVGKTSVARILAHAINNIPYDDEKMHLDIIEIDAASNRRIDEIRELRDKVHIAPTNAKYKVYIIDEVHMLTREAFNALLKTLEEPPEHVLFILATTEAHKVPETIISRTQRFTFKPIDTKDAITHLKKIAKKENIHIEEPALKLISEHGKGSFRDSISILDQLAGFKHGVIQENDVRLLLGIPDETLVVACAESVESGDISSIFKHIASFREQGIDSGRATRALSEYFRDKIQANQNTNISQHVALLRSLLPLTTTTSDYVGLELALLEAAQHSVIDKGIEQVDSPPVKEATIPRKPTKVPPVHVRDEKKDATELTESIQSDESASSLVQHLSKGSEEKVIEKNKDGKDSEIQPLNTETWNELLQEIKKQHNTLYGVLRMAHASIEGGEVTLVFNFGFHKKQIDTPKNASIIREYLNAHFGSPQFKTVHQKNPTSKEVKKSNQTEKKSDQTIITNVSNIFGGAELLES